MKLCAITRAVDAKLCEIDAQLDWLTALSPVNVTRLWQAFEASGFRELPSLEYPTLELDLHCLRERLLELPVLGIERASIRALLREKQRELDRLLNLLSLRGDPATLTASINLWGQPGSRLLRLAEGLLQQLPVLPIDEGLVGCGEVHAQALRLLARYREQVPDLPCSVYVDDALGSKLVVINGNLHIARDICIPCSQVLPLLQHEIGTHVLTHFNGSQQPLRQLSCGLAHYDSLQEGLGVLAEYLAGYLSPQRLRILAARVLAAHLTCQRVTPADMFDSLTKDHGLSFEDAFDVLLRAARGGGLTKDLVYLQGLQQVLEYVQAGGAFEFLFIGKFALDHAVTLKELSDDGLLKAPRVLPSYLTCETGRRRLNALQTRESRSLLDMTLEGPEL